MCRRSSGCRSATRTFLPLSRPSRTRSMLSTSRSAALSELAFTPNISRLAAPLIGGTITFDQKVLGTQGKKRVYVIGTPSAGPIADIAEGPAWKKFVDD